MKTVLKNTFELFTLEIWSLVAETAGKQNRLYRGQLQYLLKTKLFIHTQNTENRNIFIQPKYDIKFNKKQTKLLMKQLLFDAPQKLLRNTYSLIVKIRYKNPKGRRTRTCTRMRTYYPISHTLYPLFNDCNWTNILILLI